MSSLTDPVLLSRFYRRQPNRKNPAHQQRQLKYNCPAGMAGNFGAQEAANYHFTVVKMGGQAGGLYDLSAGTVKVSW